MANTALHDVVFVTSERTNKLAEDVKVKPSMALMADISRMRLYFTKYVAPTLATEAAVSSRNRNSRPTSTNRTAGALLRRLSRK